MGNNKYSIQYLNEVKGVSELRVEAVILDTDSGREFSMADTFTAIGGMPQQSSQ